MFLYCITKKFKDKLNNNMKSNLLIKIFYLFMGVSFYNLSLANRIDIDMNTNDISKHIETLNQGVNRNLQLSFHSGGCSIMKGFNKFSVDVETKRAWDNFINLQEKKYLLDLINK